MTATTDLDHRDGNQETSATNDVAGEKSGRIHDVSTGWLDMIAAHPDEVSRDELHRLIAIARAALALISQPMLVKGDQATWGDVAQSHSEGPKLLRDLMRAMRGDSP